MSAAGAAKPFDLKRSVLEAYAVNERMNQFLLEHLDDHAWRAEPPTGSGRCIAAIVAHLHNVRHMWLAVSAKHLRGVKIPPKLNRDTCTKKQAAAALAKSAEAIGKMLAAGLDHPEGRVRDFRPDVAGAFGYHIAHEAHHRGQISMLARQVGYPLPKTAHFGMWEWGKLWRDCGFSR